MSNTATITPASIIQGTLKRVMRLEEEMKVTQGMIDNWATKQNNETHMIEREHKDRIQSLKKMMFDFEQEYTSLEKQVREMENRVKEEHKREALLNHQVKKAQEAELQLPDQKMSLERDLDFRRQHNKQQELQLDQYTRRCQLEHEMTSMDLSFFEKYLCMKIERIDGPSSKWIRISFNQIDSNDLGKVFSFCVRVEREKYTVRDCVPDVNYVNYLHDLNQSNDFRKFIIQMRILFYQYSKGIQ